MTADRPVHPCVKLVVWLSAGVAGWLVVAALVVGAVSLLGCAEGDAGQVCRLPDAADCESHSGGELEP